MVKRLISNLSAACVFGILLYGVFIKSEVAKYKITQWVRCPDSSLRYLAMTGLSVGACAYECKIRPMCKSVGYRRLLHLCDIFSTDSLELLKNTRGDPCVFINRTDIEQDKESGCNCTEGQVCNSDNKCEVRECCPYNTTGVTIRGNQNHIGAQVTCGRGWDVFGLSSAICKADGNWSHQLQCNSSKCPAGPDSWIHPQSITSFSILIQLSKTKHQDAMTICRNKYNAELVRIDTEEKRAFITDILRSCEGLYNRNFWSDGTNEDDLSTMKFSNGETMPGGINHWPKDQPKERKKVVCARLEPNFGFRWRQRLCDKTFSPFICEKQIG